MKRQDLISEVEILMTEQTQTRLEKQKEQRIDRSVEIVESLGRTRADVRELLGTIAFDYLEINRAQKAIDLITSFVGSNEGPNGYEYRELFLLGISYGMIKDVEKSLLYLEEAIQRDAVTADGFFHYALATGSAGLSEQEEFGYRKTLELDKTYYEAWYNLGLILEERGETGKAIESFQKCVKIQPLMLSAWNSLGVAICKDGKNEEGMEAFAKAITGDPQYWEAWFNLAVCLSKLDRTEEASFALSKIPQEWIKVFTENSLDNTLDEDTEETLREAENLEFDLALAQQQNMIAEEEDLPIGVL